MKHDPHTNEQNSAEYLRELDGISDAELIQRLISDPRLIGLVRQTLANLIPSEEEIEETESRGKLETDPYYTERENLGTGATGGAAAGRSPNVVKADMKDGA